MDIRNILAKIFLVMIGVVAMGLAGYRGVLVIRETLTPQTVTVECRQIYSDFEKDNIKVFVQKHFESLEGERFNPDVFCKTLKESFKVVQHVAWRWDSFDKAVVQVQGIKPAFLVNNKVIVGDQRRVLPQTLFCNTNLDALKALKVDDALVQAELGGRDYEFLQNIPAEYWQDYTISYGGKNKIVLRHKDTGKKMVVTKKTFFDKDKITIASNRCVGKKRGRATYDLRFKNRIYARLS